MSQQGVVSLGKPVVKNKHYTVPGFYAITCENQLALQFGLLVFAQECSIACIF